MCAEPLSQRVLPRYTRVVVLLQTIVIASFSFWVFKEYRNNQYLQEYVQGRVPTGLSFLALVGALGLPIAGAVVYLSLRKTAAVARQAVRVGPLAFDSGKLDAELNNQNLSELPQERTPSTQLPSNDSLPVLVASEPPEPPILKHVEPTLGLPSGRSGPKPFPVINRLEFPEEPVEEEEQPTVSPPVLKRIGLTRPSSDTPSFQGSVRRVGPGLDPAGRQLVWNNRSDPRPVNPAGGLGGPNLDRLPFSGKDERRPDPEWKAPRKRPGSVKRPETGQGSRDEQSA